MRAVLIGVLAIHLIIVPVILQSCCGGIGNGDDVYYNIDDMSMNVHGKNTTTPSKLSDFQFLVSFQVTRAALENSYGSGLYACSPEPMISKQHIAEVLITSDADMVTAGNTIPAGESLNFKFVVNTVGRNGDPVSDLISNPLLEDYIFFQCEEVLSSHQTHNFTFEITLDDGRMFTLETGVLELPEG